MSGAGHDTGRLTATLGVRTRRVVYGPVDPAGRVAELTLMSEVDQAHLLMLMDTGLLPAAAGRALLRTIGELRASGFRELTAADAPRGIYLRYEQLLVERLGDDVGGRLHTGRSRNDLQATTTALRLRAWLLAFSQEALRLIAVLLNRARAHRDVVMPAYTHFQPAVPVTYGHYLVGVAFAAGRALRTAEAAATGLSRCPLGAGAVAGTDLPVDPEITAALLGFSTGPVHATDAVASRDVLLQVLAAVAGLGVVLSRLATDLQLWSTSEFGLIAFPDELVGSSSAMPQKRNAFLLEHVKAKAGAAIGAWTGAASMMKSTPFTNSIEVGTAAVDAAWPGLSAIADSVLLCQVLVSGSRPVPDRMMSRAVAGFTDATAVANDLVRRGVPFRTAHHLVGSAMRDAEAKGLSRPESLAWPGGTGTPIPADGLAAVASKTRHGGGPGGFEEQFRVAVAEYADHSGRLRDQRARIARSRAELARRVGLELDAADREGQPV
ncbi:argininosuccinate lyase [Actinosynnema sp. NPDC020468]|uniref:argininosuccinate lyase n=1 Tax=Actinosynnema sp. NPDC020468 TaxID=3154488 RepID=UPI0033E24F38